MGRGGLRFEPHTASLIPSPLGALLSPDVLNTWRKAKQSVRDGEDWQRNGAKQTTKQEISKKGRLEINA